MLLKDNFVRLINCSENKELLVTGGFNCDMLSERSSSVMRTLKGIFRYFDLTQMIKKATRTTRHTSTLLDLFVTNIPKNITLAKVAASSLSDHDLLIVVRKINTHKHPPRTVECRNYAEYNPPAGFLGVCKDNSLTVEVVRKRKLKVGLVVPGMYVARSKSKKIMDILYRELCDIKERYTHFEFEIVEDIIFKPVTKINL